MLIAFPYNLEDIPLSVKAPSSYSDEYLPTQTESTGGLGSDPTFRSKVVDSNLDGPMNFSILYTYQSSQKVEEKHREETVELHFIRFITLVLKTCDTSSI